MQLDGTTQLRLMHLCTLIETHARMTRENLSVAVALHSQANQPKLALARVNGGKIEATDPQAQARVAAQHATSLHAHGANELARWCGEFLGMIRPNAEQSAPDA